MTALSALQTEMRACRRCLIASHAITPGAIFSGGVDARVMIIGQAPGVTEVEARRPFNAGSGRRLFQWLGEAGWEEKDFRQHHYMTAVTKCYPGKAPSGRGDRTPSLPEQALCRPFLEREIAYVQPRLIIPVGGLAIRLFYQSGQPLSQIIGSALYQREVELGCPGEPVIAPDALDETAAGCYIVPLPHPSGASAWPNQPGNATLIGQAITWLQLIRHSLNL